MKYINTVIISELYNFLFEYYDDITLADYIIDIFSIEKTDVVQSYVAYEKFFRILHYLQSMSGDPQICFKAGVYFSEKSLLKGILIPGIRFSLKKTFRQIDDIIKNIFPDLQTSIESLDSSSLILSIHSSDISIKPSFYFTEYIKGMISIIPDHWSLPLANVEVLAYPFSIEDILGNIDVPYQKKESIFIIYDTEIAEEKLLDDDQSDDNSERKFEILKDDLFVKDIFITKKTLLNSASLKLRVNWSNTNSKKIIPFVVLSFLGIPVLTFIILKGILSIMTALSFFLYYETFIFIVYYILNKKELKKIYTKVEKSLINELSEQKNATGKAISNTINRLESIENIIEISKRIIHEKNIVNLFDNIRKLSAKALNADRTTVFIHDKENRELRSGPDLSDEKKEFRIPEDKGIAGEILRTQKILNVKDAYNNPHFNKAIDRQTGYETKTIIGAPLLDLDENLIGVIQVLNKKEGEFQKIDEHIIEILSSYIAAALRDTLAIKNLQQRGIDPDLLDGISSVNKHIFNEYLIIHETIKEIEPPAIDTIKTRMKDVLQLLEKINFLFDDHYIEHKEEIKAKDILESFRSFIIENKGDKHIIYNDKINISSQLKLFADLDLINKAVLEILINSIESIIEEGEIKIWMHNHVIIPNNIAQDYLIDEIISEYNTLSEENHAGFMNFVTSRKPLLQDDLNKIIGSMKEFIAIEIFDSGLEIKNDIKDKIFHPFFSTKNRFGLGLAVTKSALNKMGGMIEGPIVSKEGKSIRVLIPLQN